MKIAAHRRFSFCLIHLTLSWMSSWLLLASPTACCFAQETSPAIAAIEQQRGRKTLLQCNEDERNTRIQRFRAYAETALDGWPVPGFSIGIVQDGKVLFAEGFGVRTPSNSEAVDGDTLFAIASNSKAFTAAALAILVDEKKLHWDDRVQEHLPSFRLFDPYVSSDMRVVDLLCHRSGLGTFSGDLLWYGTPYTPEEILARCRHLPQAGPFRSHYGYSNVMYLAAGLIVEKVGQKPWGEFIQERILEPLHMKRSVTSTTKLASMTNIASPHKNTEGGIEEIPWMNWDSMAAAGGIISSARDMSQWMILQLNEGEWKGKPIFSKESSDAMWQPRTIIPVSAASKKRIPQTHFRSYALGWGLADYRGKQLVSHGGGYDGMYSHQILIPEEKFGVIVLTNSMTSLPDSLAYRAVDMALGAPDRDWSEENLKRYSDSRKEFYDRIREVVTPKVPNTNPSHPLEAYSGVFRCPLLGDAKVTVESEHLVLQIQANPNMVADLEPIHYDTFRIKWRNKFAWYDDGAILFIPNATGELVELKLDVPNDDLWFHELQFRRVPE
ncbi:Penicillin-binding protein 4* [Pirellula sp. SH-Sr6A]|nr:Penicillin-binding protein 4* [Pirellula sp. SH-Sr6A]